MYSCLHVCKCIVTHFQFSKWDFSAPGNADIKPKSVADWRRPEFEVPLIWPWVYNNFLSSVHQSGSNTAWNPEAEPSTKGAPGELFSSVVEQELPMPREGGGCFYLLYFLSLYFLTPQTTGTWNYMDIKLCNRRSYDQKKANEPMLLLYLPCCPVTWPWEQELLQELCSREEHTKPSVLHRELIKGAPRN